VVRCPPDFGVVVVVVPVCVLVVVVPVLVVVEEVPVVVVAGGQDSDTTAAPAGSESVDSETPCGTWSVSIAAPSKRTVTVHV